MSSVFRIAKEKRAALRKTNETATERVESPLAKYVGGRLTCCLCRCPVGARTGGTLTVWNAHLRSTGHAARLKETKELLLGKRKKDETEREPEPNEPEDDSGPTPAKAPRIEGAVPEGFFDDPAKDAKARNVQFKDPVEEEWERFRKEMKEVSEASAAIIADEREEATAHRQMDEIDEQMRHLSRVLDLTRKKELRAGAGAGAGAGARDEPKTEEEESSSEEADPDEQLDWRSKKSFR